MAKGSAAEEGARGVRSRGAGTVARELQEYKEKDSRNVLSEGAEKFSLAA